MADATDLKSVGVLKPRAGSSPAIGSSLRGDLDQLGGLWLGAARQDGFVLLIGSGGFRAAEVTG